MGDRSALLKEAYSRGILPPAQAKIYEAAVSRGLVGGDSNMMAEISKLPPVSTEEERPFESVAGLKAGYVPGDGKPRAGAKIASAIIRPTLETLGAMGGAAVVGGPTVGVGTLAGSGAGYAAGNRIADSLDNFLGLREEGKPIDEAKDSAMDILTGAAFEAGGQSLIPAIAPVGRWVGKGLKTAFSKEGAAKKAGEILNRATNKTPVTAKNIESAQALESSTPGLKFSRGQASNDPEILKFERSRARTPGGPATEVIEQRAANSKAALDRLRGAQGKGGLDDVISRLQPERSKLLDGVEDAGKALDAEALSLSQGESPEALGEVIRGGLKEGERAAKSQAGELFDDVPGFGIDATGLLKDIDDISKPFDKFEAVGKNVPSEFAEYKQILEDSSGVVTPQDLQGLSSNLKAMARDAETSANPNNRMASRVKQLIGKVETLLGKASGSGVSAKLVPIENPALTTSQLDEEISTLNASLGKTKPDIPVDYETVLTKQKAGDNQAAEKLRTARTFFKKEVIDTFKKGDVGTILKSGRNGDKVTNANVAAKSFQPGRRGGEAAKSFMAAAKDSKPAMDAMKTYIRQDLITNATNPLTMELSEKKLNTWLYNHSRALNTFGLTDEFGTITKARAQLTKAVEDKAMFDASSAAKMLDSDIGKKVKAAFSSGNKSENARLLLDKMKGDKAAISGLQNSVIDDMITRAQTTKTDAFDNKIIGVSALDKIYTEMKPSLAVLFKDSPSKLKALTQYRKTLDILQRATASPLGGGSDTAENLLTAIATKNGMTPSKIMNVVKAVMTPIRQLSEDNINALLNRATFDPEFAYTLQLAARGKPVDMVERRIKGHITSMMGRALSKDTRNDKVDNN